MPSTMFAGAGRWFQLLAACATGLLIPLCFTGPAVVLPAISAELGGTPAQLSWILNAYILSYGGAMMVCGSLTDIYGHRRILLAGLAWFCACTFAITFMPGVAWIDALRLLQGLGGAAAFAAAMAALAPLFSGPARARAFSLLGTTFGLGLAFGPWIAGWIVEVSSWRGVFHATGAVGMLALVAAAASTSRVRKPVQGRLDCPGAISFTLALGLVTYGMLRIPEHGACDPLVASALLAGALAFIGFVLIERRVSAPMLDVRFFREPVFVGVQVLAASPAFLFIALIVLLPGRFIGIDGYHPAQAGQMVAWLATPLLIMPFVAALLTRWWRPGLLCACGLLLVAVALVWLAHGVALDGAERVRLPLLLIGIGIGLPWGLMDALAVSVVAPHRVGMATGIFNTVRVSADGIAIAVISVALATWIQSGVAPHAAAFAPDAVVEAAGRLALGDLREAVHLLPGLEPVLLRSYTSAFVNVLHLLAGLAAMTACIVLGLLRGETTQASSRPAG